MTMLRRRLWLAALLGAIVLVLSGAALAAHRYADRAGDVKGGEGPDLTSVTISNTATKVTFRVGFAQAPPLGFSTREGWVDMLLIGLDVPPLGPSPVSPGGEWPGANFALGMHGPSATGMLVRLAHAKSKQVARFPIVRSGRTLTFSIPRRALGTAGWFTFSAAAAREQAQPTSEGGVDVVPDRGTLRYTLTAH